MDFRETIRKNNTRTKLVIGTYIFIMLLVGLLADVAIRPIYPNSLSASLVGYLQFVKVPYITLFILVATVVGIMIISKFGHKLMLSGTQYKYLNPEETVGLQPQEKQVLNMVQEMALSAGLPYTPKTYILETEDMNAFAAGWSGDNAIVGVTRGLMNTLTRSEAQAVIAHEIGHIIHGDSKLTLYVGILANVILTFTNIFANFAMFFTGGRNSEASNKARLLLIVLNLILPIITQVLYLYLSRTREYMADAAAVQLTGDNQAMISALRKISGYHEENDGEKEDVARMGEHYRSAAYIFSKGDSMFSTHPSIENRIKKLNGEKV
jgi:heat shock protein HtpX